MPKGEFENRDRDESQDLSGVPLAGARNLGELPDDLARERGDLRTYSIDTSRAQNPDMSRAAVGRADARDTGLGSPVLDYTVRSVYDSRPNSGVDFNLWFNLQSGEGIENYNQLMRAWLVPDGWVAVIRKVSFKSRVQSLIVDALDAEAYVALIINGARVDPITVRIATQGSIRARQLPGIPMNNGDSFDTFQVADERSSIGAQLLDSGGSPINPPVDPDPDNYYAVGFYGNFLLKTGRPAMFEPSNLASGNPRAASTTTPRDMGAIPSGENLVRSSRRKVPFANVPMIRKPR